MGTREQLEQLTQEEAEEVVGIPLAWVGLAVQVL
jgi:hypothetical protein